MRSAVFSLAIAIAAIVSCKSAEQAPAPAPAPSPVAPAAVPAAPQPSSGAQEALDRLDARTAVPLLPMMAHHQKQNMRDHLLAVQEVVVALAASDYAGVEKSAARIGYSEQMGAMCTHMGSGAPGFTEQAIGFHKTADGIVAAAKKKDRDAVLSSLGATLATCTACHAKWKQQIVDDAAWTRAGQ